MAWYADDTHLVKSDGDKDWWKSIYGPGDSVPVSGLYKCLGCKKEITSNKDDPFPPQNKHQHTQSQGSVRWKLIIRTDTEGSA
jgi:hypothetical protein